MLFGSQSSGETLYLCLVSLRVRLWDGKKVRGVWWYKGHNGFPIRRALSTFRFKPRLPVRWFVCPLYSQKVLVPSLFLKNLLMKSMFVKLLAQKHQPGSNNQLPATWMGPSLSYPFLTSLSSLLQKVGQINVNTEFDLQGETWRKRLGQINPFRCSSVEKRNGNQSKDGAQDSISLKSIRRRTSSSGIGVSAQLVRRL